MRRCWLASWLGLVALVPSGGPAAAFGGFYVGKADGPLFNQTAKVVFAHHDGKTVITMVSDYQGALEEFAIVVPVPDVLERGQIHVATGAIVDRLDAYTAPRLIRRVDDDPCGPTAAGEGAQASPAGTAGPDGAEALGVTVEAAYAAGEYDIEILSAEQSDGLAAWLRARGYRLPDRAEAVLAPYIAAGMRFFLARVDLEEQSKLGYSYLQPLQVAFESEDFMLPIRLVTLNGTGPQELTVYLLTRDGRVEAANYPTVRAPSEVELPLYLEQEFGAFYEAMFEAQAAASPRVLLEHASDLSSCDPCGGPPLSREELRALGVFWTLEPEQPGSGGAAAPDVFLTRLHLRYDAEHFPDDLRFRVTENRGHFQIRYALREPWRGEPRCQAARAYLQDLPERFEAEAQNLARLTDWPIADIRAKMEAHEESFAPPQLTLVERKWWERLWPNG
jgi:hypothetical protein